ncbi:MAG: glycoside hydrolase family 43 protein [Clostridia bacterium]|nr:glycoside hydrolase family 43 protein [Clostridia bacterium]
MILKSSGGFEARDPSIVFFEGKYYHCYSTSEALFVAVGETLQDLCTAKPTLVYTPEQGKEYSKELWAPELHIINGKCYIYVACDDGNNKNHRMYVLTNDSSDPTLTYRLFGKLSDSTNKWAIDGTVFEYGNELYTVWSGWEGDVNVCQNLYIAKMSNPSTISSERVMISTPEYDWEKKNCDGVHLPFINEGPFCFEKNGELMIFYSASGSWANNYCIGLLRFKNGDLLDKNNWVKQSFPALCNADGWNGPGHCTVFSANETDYIAFHNYDEGKTKGWDNVHAIIKPFILKNGKITFCD